jgi:hypothetical protein
VEGIVSIKVANIWLAGRPEYQLHFQISPKYHPTDINSRHRPDLAQAQAPEWKI